MSFTLNSRVFGRGGLLGTSFGTPPYSAGVNNIRIKHLLEHRSGWSNTGGDPMFMNFTTHTQVMNFMLNSRPLMATPGTRDEYLNFGYTVLGRVIEKVSGMPYEKYVKTKILKPAGISKMKIGAKNQINRSPGEFTYYPSSAYNLKPRYMDAHGGWIASSIDLARLMVRVDRNTKKRDILRPSTIDSMLTTSPIKSNYAKGHIVNNAGAGHNGEMRGTGAFWWRTGTGYTWSIIMNQRPSGDSGSFKAQTMMNNIVKNNTDWSNYDLF